MPGEVWLMMLRPSYYSQKKNSLAGAGCTLEPPATDAVATTMQALATCWRMSGRFPACAGYSNVWQTPKPDGATKYLHGLCPFFRAVCRGLYRSVPFGHPHHADQGCVPHRRPENAILAVHATEWRLRSAK
eukprot:3380890-Pyramimonas_sp.AAC.1